MCQGPPAPLLPPKAMVMVISPLLPWRWLQNVLELKTYACMRGVSIFVSGYSIQNIEIQWKSMESVRIPIEINVFLTNKNFRLQLKGVVWEKQPPARVVFPKQPPDAGCFVV